MTTGIVAATATGRWHAAPPHCGCCDTCVHRIATPGFEARLHAPLQPHHHPDDAATHVHTLPAGGAR